MASKRYQVWDEVSDVITPVGQVFTAEQWMERYPMARLDSIKLVLSGGVINGAYCGVFSSMVDMYEKQGCDFSVCIEDQDYLDAIEAFEDARNAAAANEVTAEERIASALEYQNLMAE